MKGKSFNQAQNGVLDLSDWNWADGGNVELRGEWAFYKDVLLEPGEDPGTEEAWLKAPGSWNGASYRGGEISNEGYGTYRLKIRLPGTQQDLGIRIPVIRSSCVVWLNGKRIHAVGKVGMTRETVLPAYGPGVYPVSGESGTLNIQVQVANFHHRQGGMTFPILLGEYPAVLHQVQGSLFIDIFLFGSIFMMALYHFGLFFLRKQDISTLYFGIFCLSICLHIPMSGEYFLFQMFPQVNWIWALKIDYFAFLITGGSFSLFLYHLFPREWHLWVIKLIVVCLGILAFVILLGPIGLTSFMIPGLQVFVFIGAMYTLFATIRAIRKKRLGATILFLALCILILTYANDALYSAQILNTGSLMPYGTFIFIFAQSFLLSRRFASAFSLAEIYAATFQKFVPEQFLSRIAKDGIASIKLGNAEQAQGVILFSDIRGFTPLSEKMSPREVLEFLNAYLSRLEPPLREFGGFVDKYLGDAIMGLFVLDSPAESVRNAMFATLKMKEAMRIYNAERIESGLAEVKSGIGMHYGPLIIGTVGGVERMDSTAIGDTVNLASRIEGLTKLYDAGILVTGDLISLLEENHPFLIRFADKVRVKGKTKAVDVWEVLGHVEDEDVREISAALDLYNTGIELFYGRKIELAKEKFEAFLVQIPDDLLALRYCDRCKAYLESDFPESWDEVTSFS